MHYSKSLEKLLAELEKLPGLGPKSAQRIAFHLLRATEEEAERLAEAILDARRKTSNCKICFNWTDGEVCQICADERRNPGEVMVVAEPRDLVAIEKTKEFKGRYHVLGGVISPLDGVTPEMLRVRELVERVSKGGIAEVILALNPTVEGNTTAIYLSGLIKPLGPKVTKIAQGLPIGGEMDYADMSTIISALEGRREM